MANLNDLLRDHVKLEVECIDRMYLGGYIPSLQTSGALVSFLTKHRGQRIPSPALLQQISEDFKRHLKAFCEQEKIPVVYFERKERKDDIAKQYLQQCTTQEKVLFVGVAQEKAWAFKASTDKNAGRVSFEYSRQWVYVNHYYFYLLDADFGPTFLKVCSYAPYPMRVYLNGHEWVKCQLRKEGIAFEALDSGFLSCANPERLQALSDSLSAEHIIAFFNKWIDHLPMPLTGTDREAGYQHRLSVQQMEMSLTQVLDEPALGRVFFEDVIRENLDTGRPDRVRLIFERKIIGSTPGVFRTDIITEGVTPSIHVHYKHARIKQYFKEQRALRTETTINDPYDFYVKKDIRHLARLRAIGQRSNRRMIDVIRLSHSCRLSASSFQRVVHPSRTEAGQRAPALRFGNVRVMALLCALTLILHRPSGVTHRLLRPSVAELLGPDVSYGRSQMTYDLRRLCQKGIIARLPNTNTYTITTYGRQIALFFNRLDRRVFGHVFAAIDKVEPLPTSLTERFDQLNDELDRIFAAAHLAKQAA